MLLVKPEAQDFREWNKAESPEQAEQGQKLYEALYPRIEAVEAKVHGGYIHPEPGATLWVDDFYLGGHRGSGLIVGPINAALDAVRTAAMVLQTGALPMTALYPLFRSTVENSATAIWLLQPENRDERLSRAFRLIAGEWHDMANFRERFGEEGTDRRARDASALSALVAARPQVGALKFIIDPRNRRWTSIVGEAAAALDTSSGRERHAVALWQVMSGIAHGRQWAMLTLLDRSEAMVNESKDSAWVRLTSSTQVVAISMNLALDMLDLSLRMYGPRARRWTNLPEDSADPNFKLKRGTT